jgi:hypothetical protein
MDTKKCYKCQVEKSVSEFAKNKSRRDGLQAACKACRKIYIKQHYQDNRQYYIDKAKTNRYDQISKNRDFLILLKDNKQCVDCKNFYPHYVLDFDHLRDKKYGIAQMKGSGLSIERILEEISKCELVCSNCHRIRTWKRKHPE